MTQNAINTSIPIEVSNGGTGAASLTDHGVLVGSGTSAVTALAVGATNTVIQGSTGSDPSFTATPQVTSINFGQEDFDNYDTSSSWTPVLKFGGATTGITYSAQQGGITRIGALYIANFNIVLTSKGSAVGDATVSGFTTTGAAFEGVIVRVVNLNGTYISVEEASGGATTATLIKNAAGGAGAALQETDFANDTEIYGYFWYYA